MELCAGAPRTRLTSRTTDLCARSPVWLWRQWQCSPRLLDELLQVTLTQLPVQLLKLLGLGLEHMGP